MIPLLSRWNRWGSARLPAGQTRDVTSALLPFLDTPEVVALTGPRRAGKTTVLFQIMDLLAARGVPPSATLHLNLEEPGLSVDLLTAEQGNRLLERAYTVWRDEIYPKGRGYLFLDEVQRVPGWERWVRAANEREDLKIFVTGSSSALLSRELGTLLTGRHVRFEVMPLRFGEVLRFRGIPAPEHAATPEVNHALLGYLRWGGFPEVVLAQDDARRELLLRQYFEDLLYRDVGLRHEVRDLPMLRALAVHLVANTASLTSHQRLAGIFGVSTEKVRTYCGYLAEAFLVGFCPHFSLKTAERLRNPQKVHALDPGLRNAVAVSAGEDLGHLAESAVYGALRPLPPEEPYTWRGQGEVDLLVRRGPRTAALVQVCWEGWERPELRRRELDGLAEAQARFPEARATVVCAAPAEGVVPLWRALLTPEVLLAG